MGPMQDPSSMGAMRDPSVSLFGVLLGLHLGSGEPCPAECYTLET